MAVLAAAADESAGASAVEDAAAALSVSGAVGAMFGKLRLVCDRVLSVRL